MNSEE